MSRLQQSQDKILDIITHHDCFTFRDFITCLRKALGISRQLVAEDLDIPYIKLFYIERGKFYKPLPLELLRKLSEYFDVPENLMIEKACDHLERKRII